MTDPVTRAEQLLARGDAPGCRDLCLDLIRRHPGEARLYNTLGRALNNLRNLNAAERAFRDAIKLHPELVEAHHNLGHVLRASGRINDAVASFEAAIRLDPGYARGHHNLGLTYLATDQPELAADCFTRAVDHEPGNSRYQMHLGVVRHKLKNYSGAIEAYDIALELAPDNAEARTNLAITLQETGDLDAAEAAYRQALTLRADDPKIYDDLASLLMNRGEVDSALAVCDHCLDLMPGYCGALATKAVALYELGRNAEADQIVNFDTLLTSCEIDPPEDFGSLPAFNAALAEHVLKHPTLSFEPVGHATRHGRHTGNLLRDEKGPMAHLEARIQEQVEQYLVDHPADPEHPFLANLPSRWGISSWAVVMDNQGHQLPHIHPSAWLSGVYYARLPEHIGAGDFDRAGWIEFGMPPEDMQGKVMPPLKSFQPSEGRMFLFPSYFYHRTEPFESHEVRISIAFDIMRRD